MTISRMLPAGSAANRRAGAALLRIADAAPRQSRRSAAARPSFGSPAASLAAHSGPALETCFDPHPGSSHISGIRVTTRRYSFQIVREAEPTHPVGLTLTSPREAVAIAQHVIGTEITECLLAIFVDARHRVSGYAEIARGTLNATRFTPRDVLVPALHAGCFAVILCHNHPSQEVTPSRADRRVTGALREAAQLIGIPLLDHIIVTGRDYWSFRENENWEDQAG